MELSFEVQDGAYWYRRGETLFSGVSVSVAAGRVLAILGPNGAGKTTFLKCAMGLLPWRRGRSLLDGRELSTLDRATIWRSIAYVPQARSLPFPFSVLDVALMGRSAHIPALAQPGPRDVEATMAALKRVGAAGLADRPFRELSGGEAQLVFLARALAAEPRMIVLDEPESHLDFRNQLVVLETLRSLAEDAGIACVVNTHFPDHALRIADDALLLGKRDAGHRYGPAEELLDEATLQEFFGVRVRRISFAERGFEHRAIYPLEPAL